MQRKSGDRRSTTLRHRFAFTSSPWTNTIGAPLPASKYAMLLSAGEVEDLSLAEGG